MRRMVIVALLLVASVVAVEAGEVLNRVAAVVDQEVITTYEVEMTAAPFIARAMQENPGLDAAALEQKAAAVKQDVLQSLIQQKLIESEVKRLGIEVTDQEIESYAEEIKRANNFTDETLKNVLASQGKTLEDFNDKIRKDILVDRYISFRIRGQLEVRDEDIRSYYDNHQDEFVSEPLVKIAEIRVNTAPEAEATALETSYTLINNVYEKLLAGADFAEMARQYSQGPTRLDGGVLSEFKLNTELNPLYRKAVTPLEVGQFSTIHRDRNGFVIVKLLSKRAGDAMPFEEVADKIRMILRAEKRNQEMERLAAELRKKSFVDIKVNYLSQ